MSKSYKNLQSFLCENSESQCTTFLFKFLSTAVYSVIKVKNGLISKELENVMAIGWH